VLAPLIALIGNMPLKCKIFHSIPSVQLVVWLLYVAIRPSQRFAGDDFIPGETQRYAPQALGLSEAPQAAGLSDAPQAAGFSAGLSDAPQADPQAEAGSPAPIMFQLDRLESAIIGDLHKMYSADHLAPCDFYYTHSGSFCK
jgi:hypothetical protein